MREQGGVTAAGSGAGAGAFIAYEFTAQTAQLTITLSGKDVNEGFPDHNRKIVILSRFVVLPVSLTPKVSLFQRSSTA